MHVWRNEGMVHLPNEGLWAASGAAVPWFGRHVRVQALPQAGIREPAAGSWSSCREAGGKDSCCTVRLATRSFQFAWLAETQRHALAHVRLAKDAGKRADAKGVNRTGPTFGN